MDADAVKPIAVLALSVFPSAPWNVTLRGRSLCGEAAADGRAGELMAALDRRMDSDLIESDRITCAGRRGLSPLMTFPRRSSELLSLSARSSSSCSGLVTTIIA